MKPTTILAISLLAAGALATEATSPSFVLDQATAPAGAGRSESAGYALDGTLGQPATTGSSASFNYIVQSGFWGHLGSGIVPVLLRIDRNALDPTHVDLAWSGIDAPFEIYQSAACDDIFGGFLASTGTNSFDNIIPPVAELVCYRVLPTAPGRAP